jgi:hypothetical protein
MVLHRLLPDSGQLIAQPLTGSFVGLFVLLEVVGNDTVYLGGKWQRRRLEEAIEGFGKVLR